MIVYLYYSRELLSLFEGAIVIYILKKTMIYVKFTMCLQATKCCWYLFCRLEFSGALCYYPRPLLVYKVKTWNLLHFKNITKIYQHDLAPFGGIFDFDRLKERLDEVLLELSNEALWQESPQKAQDLGKEQTQLEQSVHSIIKIEKTLEDIKDWLEMLTLESDQAIYDECQEMLSQTEQKMARLEFRRMFNHPLDQNDTYLEIQSGSGGTEAQDWAQMLMRLYLRWGEAHHLTF